MTRSPAAWPPVVASLPMVSLSFREAPQRIDAVVPLYNDPQPVPGGGGRHGKDYRSDECANSRYST
jgi:hypothetical protein